MIVRALLEWAGLQAPPLPADIRSVLHSDDAHNTLNVGFAAVAGHARILRLQKAADLAAKAGNTTAVERIICKQNDVRAALNDLARRLD